MKEGDDPAREKGSDPEEPVGCSASSGVPPAEVCRRSPCPEHAKQPSEDRPPGHFRMSLLYGRPREGRPGSAVGPDGQCRHADLPGCTVAATKATSQIEHPGVVFACLA